jgi:hypothetical protein
MIHASIIRPQVTQIRVTLTTNLMRVHIGVLPYLCEMYRKYSI